MTDQMLRLALFLFPGYHFGAWRLPDAIPEMDLGIEHYVRAARLAEEGRMDAIFFEDQAAVPRSNDILRGDTYGAASPRGIHLDPSMLLPALAMVTKHLGLAATATTTYNDPYSLARSFPPSTSSVTVVRAGTSSHPSTKARPRTSASTRMSTIRCATNAPVNSSTS